MGADVRRLSSINPNYVKAARIPATNPSEKPIIRAANNYLGLESPSCISTMIQFISEPLWETLENRFSKLAAPT